MAAHLANISAKKRLTIDHLKCDDKKIVIETNKTGKKEKKRNSVKTYIFTQRVYLMRD